MASFQKRQGAWRAIVRKKGHPSQSKTFSTKARAQKWARQVEALIEAGLIGEGNIPTIDDLCRWHLAHLERTSNRGRKNQTGANNIKRGLGAETLITEINYLKLQVFCETRIKVDGVKPSTTLLDVLFLSGAITTAVVEGRLHSDYKTKMSGWLSGLKRAGLTGNPEDRERRPSNEELELLLVHTQHNRALRRIRYHDIIRFAVDSCMRLDEICSLRWSDLDAKNGTIVVRLRKHPVNKTDQVVPLMGESQAIIEAQPRTGEKIFPFNTDSVSNGFRRVCNHLGIENLHFHDLRHEGISRLFERGYQIQEVAIVSGHRDWKSLKRYVNLKASDLARRERAA